MELTWAGGAWKGNAKLRKLLVPSGALEFFCSILLREGGVSKRKVWDLFEESGKMELPHSQDVPEALILSGSAWQEFLDLFST